MIDLLTLLSDKRPLKQLIDQIDSLHQICYTSLIINSLKMARNKMSLQMAVTAAIMLTWATQAHGFHVGQEVCVSGYITCNDCNVGAMMPYNTKYNMFQSIFHPENHNLPCLVGSESCVSDGYEIVTRYAVETADNKDEDNEVFCRSFKLDSNSSDIVAASGVSYFQTNSGIVRIGSYPVSFAGQIIDTGDSHSSLATVAIDTDTLTLKAGECANENLPHHCISRSGSYQYTVHPTSSPTTASSTELPADIAAVQPSTENIVESVEADSSSDENVSSSLASAENSIVEDKNTIIESTTDETPASLILTDASSTADESAILESTEALVTNTESSEALVTDGQSSQTADAPLLEMPSLEPDAIVSPETATDTTENPMNQESDTPAISKEENGSNTSVVESNVSPSESPTSTNATVATTEISALASASNDDTAFDDRVDIVIGDVLKIDSSQEPTYTDKETEIKELFKNHGKLAGASWGILVPLAMSAAWFRESFPMIKSNGNASCGSRLCNQAWLLLHASMAVIAAVATSVSVYFVVKALSMEGGLEYAMQFSHPHQYMGIFLLVGAWVQVLGGIFRPKNKYLEHAKMLDDAGDEENTKDAENEEASISVSSTSTMKHSAIIHKWRRSTNLSGEISEIGNEEESVVTITSRTKARKTWDFGHRFFALILVICGFWQLFSGLDVYQERYGDDSYLVTACMVWVGVFWSVIFLLTCFYKKF